MAWLTTATSANLITSTTVWQEQRYFPFTGAAESRINTTTVNRYVGIITTSADDIVATLVAEANTVNVVKEEQGDGSVHIVQTKDAEGTWA